MLENLQALFAGNDSPLAAAVQMIDEISDLEDGGLTLDSHPTNDEPAAPEPPPITVRSWKPGYPFTCQCGEPTGWTTDGVGVCPSCEFGDG